jgi:hypothetical protein
LTTLGSVVNSTDELCEVSDEMEVGTRVYEGQKVDVLIDSRLFAYFQSASFPPCEASAACSHGTSLPASSARGSSRPGSILAARISSLLSAQLIWQPEKNLA